MKIESLKDLQKVLRLCRREGVTDIKISGIELHLGPITTYATPRNNLATAFPEASVRVPTYQPINAQETEENVIEAIDMPDELSEEQLLMWSAKSEPQ